ncbi:helix-turn-helix domain-containing protein [Dactylosporangium aurantiacum]|uniref:Helix-turn-helix domain-containing protein n=1 Tax=Dactylosporangium aurantiacum TaxID=35754 RepID=A0A9Q9IC26_9ACTN|nr:helix-turn-helix domain-containing protein [Dactylosporangium aurantiacum]MDG6107219.1 helix-turn-helix domain-containing protein [Dactylosporangium aurantiacum]UWZ51247.1 helix-turn-helix domain-containing protein [Dactylosporangium aurantiacum]
MSDEFAMLLRRHRLHCQLTQEELAERAGISARSVGEMERGRGRSPRPRTVDQLAAALELTATARDEFTAAGRALFWVNRPGRSRTSNPLRLTMPTAAVPRQLPADLPDFVARHDETALICRVLDPDSRNARLVAVSGPAGVGKTALAVHAGHRLAARFPDGQVYAALRGPTGRPVDPAEVLAQLLRALGADSSALPAGAGARAGLLRSWLADRRVLIVLDDADGHRQVEPFMPTDSTAVLVTSRLPLTGLSGVTAVDLRPLPTAAGVDLLCRVAGTQRVRSEPAAACELVTICGGLPLAVRIAAARLAARPHWTVTTLSERLADERHRLDELRHGDLAVRPGLQLAYEGLSPAAATAFALLGALDVPTFPGWAVAALLGTAPDAGAAALDELLDARLLDDLGPDQAGQRRYGFHQITRLYARERRALEVDPQQWSAALERAALGWLALARHAQDRLRCERFHLDDRSHPAVVPDPAARAAAGRAVEWFEAERAALAAIVSGCAEAGLAAAAHGIAGTSADFYELRGYYDDWHRAVRAALDCCRRTGDRRRESAMLRGLGACLVELNDPDEALSTLRDARTLAEALGDRAGAAMVGKDIGFVLSLTGRLAEAETELRAAVEDLDQVGRRQTKAMALTSLGFVLRQQGATGEAVRTIQAARDIARSCRDPFTEAYCARGLAGALLADGRTRQAQRAAGEAAELFARIGDPIGAAQSLRVLGESLAQEPDRAAEAEEALDAAATMFRDRRNSWGLALTELTLGEIGVRRGADDAVERLERTLRYWTEEQVPALQARTLVALAGAAERAADPSARQLLMDAYRLYEKLGMPAAAELADRLARPGEDATAG